MSEEQDVSGDVDATAEVVADTVVNAEPEQAPEGEVEVEAWDSERALAKIRKANAEAKRLRERVKEAEEKAAQHESLEAEVEKLRLERDQLQRDALRQKVAHTYGLDPVLASRLRGDTVEALQEDAQALLEVVEAGRRRPQAPMVPHKNGGAIADADIASMVAGLL